MRALLLSFVMTVAQPGVVAAAQSPAADEPERILATELPTRAEVWARFEAAVARQAERSFSSRDPFWFKVENLSDLVWELYSFGRRTEAAEIALDLSQEVRSHLSDEHAVADSRTVIDLLILTGEIAEANELANALIEESRRRSDLAEDDAQVVAIERRLARSLDNLPDVQRSLIEGILNRPGLSDENYVILLEELVDLEIYTGRLQRALHLQTRLLEIEQNSWDYFEAAALLAMARPGPGEGQAIRWAQSTLETHSELSGWFNHVARTLNSQNDALRAARFSELAMRAALSDPDGLYADDIASSAFQLAQAGRCDLALPGVDLAELLVGIDETRDAIARLQPVDPEEDSVIVIAHGPSFVWQAAGLVIRTRLICGQPRSAFERLFDEDADGWLRNSVTDIRNLLLTVNDDALGQSILVAFGGTIARRHISGRSRFDEEYTANDELAFTSVALRQAGYFQLADEVLLAAWNDALGDNVWSGDVATIYAALPED